MRPGDAAISIVVPINRPVAVMVPAQRGPQGKDGTDSVTVSPDDDNLLEKRDNGLFVPPATWQTSDW